MTDTQIGAGTNDGAAVVFPQDSGTGTPSSDADFDSAAYFAALSRYTGDGSYIGEDNSGNATLTFTVDTANNNVDISSGYAYIQEGSHTVQSADQTSYDTTLPIDVPYVVILPNSLTDLGLGTDNDNDVWLALDSSTNDSIYIRHGNGLSAPTDPSVKLGTVNTSSGATTRPNDLSSPTFGQPEAVDAFENATYATLSDVPGSLPEGTQVWVNDENQLYVEDGT